MLFKSIWLALIAALIVTVTSLDSAMAASIEQQTLLNNSGYQSWEWLKSDCDNCELLILPVRDELRTEKVQLFIQALGAHKADLQALYKISGPEYNLLAHMAVGILGRESEFFQSPRYQFKEAFPGLVRLGKILRFLFVDNKGVSENSRGPTQIKIVPEKIASAYGIDTDHLYIPENAAVATMGFLIEALGELKRRVVVNRLDFVTPATYADYLPYIYFGSTRALIKGSATPGRNLYVQAMKEYMTWVELYEREQVPVPLR